MECQRSFSRFKRCLIVRQCPRSSKMAGASAVHRSMVSHKVRTVRCPFDALSISLTPLLYSQDYCQPRLRGIGEYDGGGPVQRQLAGHLSEPSCCHPASCLGARNLARCTQTTSLPRHNQQHCTKCHTNLSPTTAKNSRFISALSPTRCTCATPRRSSAVEGRRHRLQSEPSEVRASHCQIRRPLRQTRPRSKRSCRGRVSVRQILRPGKLAFVNVPVRTSSSSGKPRRYRFALARGEQELVFFRLWSA
jgi:hypothetical protein